jgi:hypothetical protein
MGMIQRPALALFGALLLAGCGRGVIGNQTEDESARQIANRADEISAAADAAVNQQIRDIEDASEAEPMPGNGQN